MALRRGFKSEAERIARDVRTELGMKAAQSVEPEVLAKLLGIKVQAGDELIPVNVSASSKTFSPIPFSACTLRPSPDRLVVVYNPLSAESRRRSDVATNLHMLSLITI